MAIKINVAMPKTLTFDIMDNEYQLKISPKRLAHKAIELQESASKIQSVTTTDDFNEAYATVESAAVGIIDEMFGEGSAAKITGGAEVQIGWYANLITEVLKEVTAAQSNALNEKYA